MSLLKYFQAKGPTLPSSSTRAYSSLSRKDLDYANKEVKRALAAEDSGEKVVTRRGKYNSYTPKERAQIGKYALENGNSRAARHFSKVLDRQIRESTARRLKDEYVRALAQKKNDPEGPVVKCLPTKAQGRPLLLGQELDKAVQEYIEATRAAGGDVNTAIVMAAAVGIVSSRDVTKLSSNGGYVNITKTWAKSLLKRMGYVKRKCSNAGKISPIQLAQIQEVFLADIKAQVVMNDIPDELIINWDQTGVPLVPTGGWTMHRAGDRIIPIANSDDKRQITAVLAASMAGEYLPPQLIFKGKTQRCHPQVSFPKGWDIWHSENHWSNEDTMQRYIEQIIVPYIDKKRQDLDLEKSHTALVLFDCFRGQTTATIESLLQKNNIVAVQIPPNCTDKLQPMDVSINKPMKDGMRTRFQTWYASEVQKQLKDAPLDQVKVNVTAAAIKPLSANWVISTWQEIENRPDLAINGFRAAGIVGAVASIRD